ncbi:methionyl-tRNA formyltransferase [Candidatus Gottesmanbacteria bacterium]|nr:methionyl-tRNA formyltransferase [Candidatus Gottesmanbacteria bacterium]
MNTRIIFFGSSIHSLPALNKLIQNGYEITAVVTQPDRPVGRKQVMTPTPVSVFARTKNIPIIKPQSTKPILQLKPDLLIVCYYGQKIPIELINKVKSGGLNIHPSLLPKYRGAAPSEWAILKGEKETGVTILKLSEEFDEGEIISQVKESILKDDNPENLYARLFKKGADLLIKVLPDFLQDKIELKPQNNSKATFAPKLTKEDGEINWDERPELIERKIRAFTPWPGSFTFVKLNGKTLRLKVLKAHLKNDKLVLDEVQLEGKNPVSFKEFKTAYPNYSIIKSD